MRWLIPVLAVATLAGEVSADETTRRAEALRVRIAALRATDNFAARDLQESLVALLRRARGDRHPETISALRLAVGLHMMTGSYARAERLMRGLFDGEVAAHGVDSMEAAAARQSLASVVWTAGRAGEAAALYRRSIASYVKAWGARDKRLGFHRERYGDSLASSHRLAEAEASYWDARQIYHRARERGNVASLDRKLGELFASRGDRSELFAATQRYTRYYEKSRPGLFPRMLATAAEQHDRAGDPKAAAVYRHRAERAYRERLKKLNDKAVGGARLELAALLAAGGKTRRAIAAYRRALAGADPVVTGEHQMALARLLVIDGRIASAESVVARLVPAYEKRFGPAVALRPVSLRAEILGRIDPAKARAERSRAVTLATSAYGRDHPRATRHRAAIAMLDIAAGKRRAGVRALARAFAADRRTARVVLAGATESDARAYLDEHRDQLDVALTVAAAMPGDRAARTLALETVAAFKGRALELAAARAPGGSKGEAALRSARGELASLVLAGHPDRARRRQLERRVRALEARLAGQTDPIPVISAASINRAVRRGRVPVVELARYQPIDLATGAAGKSGERYAALVITGRAPRFVDLGVAASIDRAIDGLGAGFADPTSDEWRPIARRLHARLIEPLGLGKLREVIIAPDSALSLLPFSALVDKSDRLMIERVAIRYHGSARELLAPVPRPATGRPMVVADPDFDRGAGKPRARWGRLRGTAEEADAIAPLIGKSTVLRRASATEAAVKAASRPALLHVATHGFFRESSGDLDPLLRTGLVLAGANRPKRGAEDGVLTALEAAGLDLGGTRLVVLSACETGLGAVRRGHGVYGLRRAFAVAGARTVVMSLWEVDDAATRDLMIALYRRLGRGAPSDDALHRAQLAMLRGGDRAHPHYWAGFVGSGPPAKLGRPKPINRPR